MRSRYLVILGLTGTLAIGACSSSSVDGSKTQTNSTNGVVASNSANNSMTVTNGMVVAPQSADANALANTSSDPTLPPNVQDKLNKMNADPGAQVDAAALALKNARPAPDNSTFASYLTDAGHEIRTFKNHPQLLKAEKITFVDGKQTLKIFLRNGKIVEQPGERIPILSTASAATIAEVAGIAPPPVSQPAPGTTTSKKPSN